VISDDQIFHLEINHWSK